MRAVDVLDISNELQVDHSDFAEKNVITYKSIKAQNLCKKRLFDFQCMLKKNQSFKIQDIYKQK